MIVSLFHSLWTLVSLIIFIGIIVWACSAHRKKAFDEAAHLPLEEDNNPARSEAVAREVGHD